jgi:LPS sulfotransferase NodH
MNRYLCIVAGQRAGTTALQSALGSTSKFYNFGEIFHTETPHAPGNYLQYARERRIMISDVATEQLTSKIAHEYLTYLRGIASEKLPLLDVKLNSWNVIKPFWSYIHQRPFFMDVLLNDGALFLVIRRRDIVEQVMSEQIARSTGKWHGLQEGDVGEKIVISTKFVAAQARLILQAETFLLGCLTQSNRLIAIDYEDLYPEGRVNPALLGEIERYFGVELPKILRPSIKKNVLEKRHIVENYDEALEAVNNEVKRFPRPKLAHQIV